MSDVSVSLGLDAQELYNELQQASQHLVQFASKAKAEGAAAGKGFSAGFAGLGGSIAGALAGLGIGAEIKSVTEYGEKIQDLSDRFGVSTDNLQKFGNAAEKNGSSLEAVARGFRFLEVNQAKALSGNEAMAKSFEALGISIKDLESLRPEQIAEKIGHSSLNAADFVKVFGKSAIELRPLLAGLADGTIQFGDAIDDVDIKNLKEANVAMKHLKESVTILAGTGLGTFFQDIELLAGRAGGRVEGLRIEIAGLAEILSKFKPDIHNLNPFHAAEQFKEIRKVNEQIKRDEAAAAKAGDIAAYAYIADKLPAKTGRDFGDPKALGESEAGASDDQGRPLSKAEARRREKEKEKEAKDAAKVNPFEGLTLREALQSQSVQQQQAAAASQNVVATGLVEGPTGIPAGVDSLALAKENQRIAALDGQSNLEKFKFDQAQLAKDHAADLGASMIQQETEKQLRAPTMEDLLRQIEKNQHDNGGNL